MKLIEDIKQIKDKEDFKIFAKKYHIIAISLGLFMAISVGFFPTDYTESIEENNKNISSIKAHMEDRKKEYEKEVNEEYIPKVEEINLAISKLDEEIEPLKAEKTDLSNKVNAKKKAEAEVKRKEEEAKRKEEEERKKGKWALESNGYNVWEAYLTPGTYQLSITHKGGGNCIVWAGTRDNQKQNLVVNQIGKGTFAGTFKVKNAGYYTLTFQTDAAFTFEYKGF